MDVKGAFDRRDELLGELLVYLRTPAPPPTLEARLRMTFRECRARRVAPARARAVIGLAAAMVLAAVGVLYVARVSTPRMAGGPSKPVVTPLSLEGFEPVLRPKLARLKDGERP
jgi:hypothetical protein